MANRLVSQLPENTNPEPTDWILGASGSSPSALQRIPVHKLLRPENLSELVNDANYVAIEPAVANIGQSIRWNGEEWEFFLPSSGGGEGAIYLFGSVTLGVSIEVSFSGVIYGSFYFGSDVILKDF